uniref:Taxilin beta b n=1 Tax=Tetraodon nigroviridis TaxID=99883 RepID=H3CKJ1_TETNG
LQAESRRGAAARADLEVLCRDVQMHCRRLWEETARRCSEEEERRTRMASHFQAKLEDIQAQIEQHSARNHKLCRENAHLTDKLELLVNQCQVRDESLEKISKHHELQLQLAEAKLQQANALLADAQDKHKREKEYLLREAIEKTKKCFAMKEQELSMKKKLTLYAQKFDEFQGTLAKSNQIYARFKQEMDNMTEKMKKMEKETNVWKSRFENCNKALTDMMEERTEKGKEFQLFVLKIHKLEKLCRALQDERAVLYRKIKEVRVKGQSPEEEAAQEPDPAGPTPEASSWPAQVLEEEDQREKEGATVAPPTEALPAASDPSRKQTSKKKKKK